MDAFTKGCVMKPRWIVEVAIMLIRYFLEIAWKRDFPTPEGNEPESKDLPEVKKEERAS